MSKLIAAGTVDVTTYFQMRLLTGGDATGLTITDFDLTYVRTGATPATKVDATALGAANSAHSDNKMIEVNSTNQPGLYRVDWPDAAFASGVVDVILTVKHTSCFTESQRVNLSLVDEVWDEVLTGATHNVASSAGRRLRTADVLTLDAGTAQAGAADSLTLATSASTTAGNYVGCLLVLETGTGAGQSRYIVGYTTGRVAYVARHWTVTPDATTTYAVYADNQVPFVHMGLAQGGGANTITLQTTASATDNIYNGQTIRILSGTGDDQIRMIESYNGTTKVATVDPAWTTQPDNTSYYGTLMYGLAWVTHVDNGAKADIRAAIGLASANLDTQLDALPTAAENTTAVLAGVVEGTTTVKESLMLANAANAGKTDGFIPGTSGTGHLRNLADTKNRVTADYDANGNRTSTTTDFT
jgi:hypothetical protein